MWIPRCAALIRGRRLFEVRPLLEEIRWLMLRMLTFDKISILRCLLLRQIDFITQAQSHSLKRSKNLIIICRGKIVAQSKRISNRSSKVLHTFHHSYQVLQLKVDLYDSYNIFHKHKIQLGRKTTSKEDFASNSPRLINHTMFLISAFLCGIKM